MAFLVIGCLSVALACAIGFVTKSQHKKMARISAAQEAEDITNPSERKNQLSNLLVETSERAPQKPARPQPATAPAADPFANLKIQAIMYNGKKSSLVINGRSLRVGDEVDGARILAVQPNEVTLEKAGLQRVLRLQ